MQHPLLLDPIDETQSEKESENQQENDSREEIYFFRLRQRIRQKISSCRCVYSVHVKVRVVYRVTCLYVYKLACVIN